VFDSIAIHPRAVSALAVSFFIWSLNKSFLSKWIPSQHIDEVTNDDRCDWVGHSNLILTKVKHKMCKQ